MRRPGVAAEIMASNHNRMISSSRPNYYENYRRPSDTNSTLAPERNIFPVCNARQCV